MVDNTELELIAQEEDLYLMANLEPEDTGLPFVVWVSQAQTGALRHDIRVKVTRGVKLVGGKFDASVGIRPAQSQLNDLASKLPDREDAELCECGHRLDEHDWSKPKFQHGMKVQSLKCKFRRRCGCKEFEAAIQGITSRSCEPGSSATAKPSWPTGKAPSEPDN